MAQHYTTQNFFRHMPIALIATWLTPDDKQRVTGQVLN